MMGEKVLTMGLAMVVSIVVARYLGPENYGILSYAVSLASLFAIATHMGLSGLVVRELVNKPEKHEELMGTIFGIKFGGALLAFITFLIFIIATGNTSEAEFWVLLVVSGIILLKPFEIFDFWFQAKVKAKYSSIVKATSTIAISIIKLGFVLIGAKLLAFAYAYLIQAVLIALLFIYFFKTKGNLPFKKWSFKLVWAKKLLGQGWMIMFGAIFAIVYLKIDQVMIRWMVNAEEVGIYSVAAKLSEAWYFLPGIVVASLFPKLIELKKKDKFQFDHRLQQLFDMLYGIALSLAIVITVFAEPVIGFLYGSEFSNASTILSIHIWGGIFVFMRAVFDKWIIIENAFLFSMISQGLGALFNVLLNLYLINQFGGQGAALATLISYSIASYFSLIFHEKSRVIFIMMTKSIVSPMRYLSKIKILF